MDFSKKGTLKKQRQVKSTAGKLGRKAGVTGLRLMVILGVFIVTAGGIAAFGTLRALTDSAPDLDDISVVPTGYRTNIYDSEGNLMDTLVGAEANREYVTIDQIPAHVQHCFVAIEDERFYEHDGIDVRGIFRAAYSVLKVGGLDFGASTITQQLIKQQVFNGGNESNPYDKIKRKIQEQYLSIQLENELSKDQILEYYLNTINLGNGAWGVQTAAREYFNKDVGDLTLSEAAVLAPISLSPVRQNPLTHRENNEKRRSETLENMLALGFCTEAEYQEALEDNVYERIQAIDAAKEEAKYNSYFTDEVIDQVYDALQEAGYTAEQADKMLYSGGLGIYTTQDPLIQNICDEVFSEEENFPAIGHGSHYELNYALSIVKADGSEVHYQMSDMMEYFREQGFTDPEGKYVHKTGYFFTELGYDKEDMLLRCTEFRNAMLKEGDTVSGERKYVTLQPQCSMTIIDQTTGHVAAIVGGRGEKQGDRTLNRATGTLRQVGSTFKVLASFLPALDTAGLTLASVQDDSKYYYPNSGKEVINWEKGVYEGLTSIRRGIYRSKNIVAVKTLVQIGPQLGFDYLKKLGFSHLVEKRTTEDGKVYSDITPALALGGLTDGVTNLELTAAYAAIANGGAYIKPIFYTKVVDQEGNVILSNETKASQVMKTSTAFLLTDAMEDTVTIGTGTNLHFHDYQMPVAGKTGTTSDTNDLWFVGYTPYYTAAIWTGYDNNRSQTNKSYHQLIWREIMERIHSEKALDYREFEKPDTVMQAVICTKCGKLAIDGLCNNALGGSCVKTEYFAKGTAPTEKCSCHLTVTVCKETGKFATEFCPDTEEVIYLVKEETGETNDTPNILPSGADTMCTVHTAAESAKPSDETTDEDDGMMPEEPPSDGYDSDLLWVRP